MDWRGSLHSVRSAFLVFGPWIGSGFCPGRLRPFSGSRPLRLGRRPGGLALGCGPSRFALRCRPGSLALRLLPDSLPLRGGLRPLALRFRSGHRCRHLPLWGGLRLARLRPRRLLALRRLNLLLRSNCGALGSCLLGGLAARCGHHLAAGSRLPRRLDSHLRLCGFRLRLRGRLTLRGWRLLALLDGGIRRTLFSRHAVVAHPRLVLASASLSGVAPRFRLALGGG